MSTGVVAEIKIPNQDMYNPIFSISSFLDFSGSPAMLARHSRLVLPRVTRWARMNSGSNNKYVILFS